MNISDFQTTALKLFQKLKIIPSDLISSSHLDYQIPLEKHLDEYRELLFEIEHQTHFFTQIAPHWSKSHALLHDDLLEHLLEKKGTKEQQVQQYRTRPKPPFLHTEISRLFTQPHERKE